MSKEALVKELHKPARKNFRRRQVIQRGLNDTFEIDLVEMIPYSKENKSFKYILTAIDIFSKFAYAVPLKNKTGNDVAAAMKRILVSTKPKNIHSDLGKEFFNKTFQTLMQKFNINHYHTYSKMKASIVERFNRTLKNKMWRQFSIQGSYKWLPILNKLVSDYNNSKHRTIKMEPAKVNHKNAKKLLKTVYNRIKKFQMGKFRKYDHVRISKDKGIFSKGYLPNWSTEIFKICKVNMTNPVTYTLEDLNGNLISGKFYEQELQRTSNISTYLVEKVLKQKGNKVFVKWLGFDNSQNSWIYRQDLI